MGTTQAVVIKDESGESLIVTSGRILVDLSGTTITATTNISGQTVFLASGSNNVNISGSVFEFGSSLLTANTTVVPSLSGGAFLGSGAVFEVKLRPVSGNAPMWIGGAAGTNVPFSGHGILLYHSDDPMILKVGDVGEVKAFAETSGQRLSWVGTVR